MEEVEAKVFDTEVEKEKSPLQKFWENATKEQKVAIREQAAITRHENAQEKREIQKATEKLMKKMYRFKDATGKIVIGNGYEARANAMYKEVVSRGKNMVQADKQLQSYLGEDLPQAQNNNNILVIFSNEDISI